MDKRKILIRAGVLVLVIVGVIVCGILSVKSNGLFAESKDGLWKAYIVKDRVNPAGGYQGYLFYYGNHQGDIGEISIECLANTDRETSPLKAESHKSGPIESLLVGNANREGYAFQETKFKKMKGSSLGIVWNDSGEERYSSLTF